MNQRCHLCKSCYELNKYYSSALYPPVRPDWAPDGDKSVEGICAEIKEPLPSEASVKPNESSMKNDMTNLPWNLNNIPFNLTNIIMINILSLISNKSNTVSLGT